MPIESFVTTFFADWLNWTFFWWLEPCLFCRRTQPHATTSCRSQSATTCDSSYVSQNTTPYWKSTTPVLPCTTKYTSVLLCTTKCTPYLKVLLHGSWLYELRAATPHSPKPSYGESALAPGPQRRRLHRATKVYQRVVVNNTCSLLAA